jgi:lysozyme
MDVFTLLKRHEGLELKPYCDKCGESLRRELNGWYCGCAAVPQLNGNITIGIGRNLTEDGISPVEAETLLTHDITTALVHLHTFKWYDGLDVVRQAALIDLNINLGSYGFDEFTRMTAALSERDYTRAGAALRDSAADHQEPRRIEELAKMLETGQWPTGDY